MKEHKSWKRSEQGVFGGLTLCELNQNAPLGFGPHKLSTADPSSSSLPFPVHAAQLCPIPSPLPAHLGDADASRLLKTRAPRCALNAIPFLQNTIPYQQKTIPYL